MSADEKAPSEPDAPHASSSEEEISLSDAADMILFGDLDDSDSSVDSPVTREEMVYLEQSMFETHTPRKGREFYRDSRSDLDWSSESPDMDSLASPEESGSPALFAPVPPKAGDTSPSPVRASAAVSLSSPLGTTLSSPMRRVKRDMYRSSDHIVGDAWDLSTQYARSLYYMTPKKPTYRTPALGRILDDDQADSMDRASECVDVLISQLNLTSYSMPKVSARVAAKAGGSAHLGAVGQRFRRKMGTHRSHGDNGWVYNM